MKNEEWNQLQTIVERFEQDCAESFPRSIHAYLPKSDGPLRRDILVELVRTEIELLWKRRQRVFLEQYLTRFPELFEHVRFPELVHDEFRLRRQMGEKPSLAEYSRRFPKAYSKLVELAGEGPEVSGPELKAPAGASITMPGVPENSFSMAARFRKVRKIGSGAFGEVWEAQAPGGVPVAIKRIHSAVSPQAIQRERASLDLICSGKLRHPFLLQIFGWWLQDDRLHVVMELADGSLDQRLRDAKQKGLQGLRREELEQVMVDAADALDYLNLEKKILHRDIKPANMLLMAHRLKLADFGLTRTMENLGMGAPHTQGAGTPVFMSPEIINGYQSKFSDQYSLAATYYMLRTGKPLFRGALEAIRDQHLHALPALDDECLSKTEKRVLQRALSKTPEDRYPSIREFVRELFGHRPASRSDSPAASPAWNDGGSLETTLPLAPVPANASAPVVDALDEILKTCPSEERAAIPASVPEAARGGGARPSDGSPRDSWKPLKKSRVLSQRSIDAIALQEQARRKAHWRKILGIVAILIGCALLGWILPYVLVGP